MNNTPQGYMQNAQGHLVPLGNIREIDKLRNDLVSDIIASARGLQTEMQTFKNSLTDDIDSFIELAAEQYNVKMGGKKGNLSLTSYDGRYKVMLAVSDTQAFDERVQIAKKMIDECIHRWTIDSDDKVKALIEHAFQVDKAGNINTKRVLSLFDLQIDDQPWQESMKCLKDSITIVSSKSYIRLYERVGENGKYAQISMDMSAL